LVAPVASAVHVLAPSGVSIEFVVKSLETATQGVCSTALIALKMIERRLDQRALHVFDPRAHANIQVFAAVPRIAAARPRVLNQRHEFERVLGENEGSLHAIPQLTHVAWPSVLPERHARKRG